MQLNAGKIILIVVLVLALLAAVAFGVWYWQRQEVNRLNDRIAELEQEQSAQVNRLNEQVRKLEEDLAEARRELEQQAQAGEEPVSNEYTSLKGVTIQVDTPRQNEQVTSPLKVTGQVPGNWSFEADFPVELRDGDGNVIAQAPATLLGDWMTEELVPFEVTLTFTSPGSGTGLLVLQKDNPSGLPENDDSVIIPIRF